MPELGQQIVAFLLEVFKAESEQLGLFLNGLDLLLKLFDHFGF